MISRYLAGECRSFDAAALEKHLAGCLECASELAAMRKLDRLLDLWDTAPAPGDLYTSVMEEVARAGSPLSTGKKPVPWRNRFDPSPAGRWPGPLLRDLAAAAAVSLAVLWGAGNLLEGLQAAAGKSAGEAASAYTRTVDRAFAQAAGTADEYTRKIFFEEWK